MSDEEQSDTSPSGDKTHTRTWRETPYWHGTPALFAHIVRVLHSVASGDDADSGTLTIDVQVRGDHEIFTSVDDFLRDITREALRDFSSITVESGTKLRAAALVLNRPNPWWDVDADSKHPESGVVVIAASDQSWEEGVHQTIATALRRGARRLAFRRHNAVVPSILFGLFLGCTLLILQYLFPTDSPWLFFLFLIPGVVVGGLAGLLLGSWVFPAIEIAPKGSSNFRRLFKVVGPILLAIALAGVTKKLFG
jgi:hypothetical protein